MSVADSPARATSDAPPRAGLILATLILSAAVANMNLAVANVALPTIGRDLEATQTQLNLVAVGFTLGLAASVLYLGALADRYGRRRMLLGGLLFSIVAAAVAALPDRRSPHTSRASPGTSRRPACSSARTKVFGRIGVCPATSNAAFAGAIS